ncbi:MAG: helix-turn-helix domain-containing protein [Microgenomates group bacterium]
MESLTTWEFSLETEAKRILHTAYQTYVGFYKSNGFIVLPKNIKTFNSNIVILPKIDFNSIPKFWKRVSKIDIYANPMVIDKNLIADFKNLLSKYNLETPNYKKTMQVWAKAEKEVINAIYDVLPDKKDKIKKIVINPTKTGTVCSFDWDNQGNFLILLRDDQNIHKITEALVTSLTREDIYEKLSGLWQESEIISDFLITQTKIADVLKKYEPIDMYSPTMKGVRSKDVGNLLKISSDYYKELSIPNFDTPFSLNGLTPEVNKKPILDLTNNEKQILYLLIKNSNNLVSFDQISDIIFVNEEKFSLFALAKFIQRLREKLEKNGISGSFIQTLRGKGYLLKN